MSQNYRKPCFALKYDIKKFFGSVDHQILIDLIKKKVKDKDVLWLIEEIIQSFSSRERVLQQVQDSRERERESRHCGIGLPIGNLTSQIFANIYLDEFDQFIKHKLKIKYYLRYCDDFVILDTGEDKLEKIIPQLSAFLQSNLKLTLHPNKIIIRKLRQGIDFLGYVVLPYYRVLRTKTKRRMIKKVSKENISSYLGLINHCDAHKLRKDIVALLIKGFY